MRNALLDGDSLTLSILSAWRIPDWGSSTCLFDQPVDLVLGPPQLVSSIVTYPPLDEAQDRTIDVLQYHNCSDSIFPYRHRRLF